MRTFGVGLALRKVTFTTFQVHAVGRGATIRAFQSFTSRMKFALRQIGTATVEKGSVGLSKRNKLSGQKVPRTVHTKGTNR